MRAFIIDEFKTPGHFADRPVPEAGPDDVRIRITAAGVNPVDWKIRAGMMSSLPLPRVLGQDFAGVVDAAGANVRRLGAGDRVVGCARTNGSFAELTVVGVDAPGEPIARIPDGVSDAVACALPTPGLTALGCLNAAAIGAGTQVLIVGAGGAVGSIATQLAVVRGARAIATVRTADAQRIRGYRPEHVVEADDAGQIIEATKAAAPDGVSAVIDLVSDGETLKRYADVITPGGMVVTTVHVANEAWFEGRGIRALNIVMNETPESSAAGLDELTGLVRDGKLEITLGEQRPLADARDVLDSGERHELHGKTVLLP